jgi:hypothetical protein
MALVREYWGFFSIGDSARKTGSIEFRIPTADFTAYVGAADPDAAQGTATGLLFTAYDNLMIGSMKTRGVKIVDNTFPYTYPAVSANAYRTNKIKVSFAGGADIYTSSIPNRDATKYTAPDGINIDITASGTTEVKDFVAKFNGHVVAKNGELATVQAMYVNDV